MKPARRRLTAALALAAALSGATAAEGTEVQAFRDWALRCPDGADCALEQRIFEPGGDTPLMSLLLQLAGAERQLMAAIRVPLSVVLPEGISLAVDDAAPERVPFHHCRTEGCFAIFPVPERLARRLRAGNVLTLSVQRVDGSRISVPASLLGITAGLRALGEAR